MATDFTNIVTELKNPDVFKIPSICKKDNGEAVSTVSLCFSNLLGILKYTLPKSYLDVCLLKVEDHLFWMFLMYDLIILYQRIFSDLFCGNPFNTGHSERE